MVVTREGECRRAVRSLTAPQIRICGAVVSRDGEPTAAAGQCIVADLMWTEPELREALRLARSLAPPTDSPYDERYGILRANLIAHLMADLEKLEQRGPI